MTDDRYIFIHSALDEAGLTVRAFRLLAHLSRRSDGKSATASAAVASMSRTCRMEEKSVKAALRELIGRKIITREPRAGMASHYRITPPATWAASLPGPFGTPGGETDHPPGGETDHPLGRSAPPEGNPIRISHKVIPIGDALAGVKQERISGKNGAGAEDFAAASAYELDMTAPPAIKAAWLEWQQYHQSRHLAKGKRHLPWTLQAARLSAKSILAAVERHGEQIVTDRISAAIEGNWQGLNLDKLEGAQRLRGARKTRMLNTV